MTEIQFFLNPSAINRWIMFPMLPIGSATLKEVIQALIFYSIINMWIPFSTMIHSLLHEEVKTQS